MAFKVILFFIRIEMGLLNCYMRFFTRNGFVTKANCSQKRRIDGERNKLHKRNS